ncbi:MAG TPA: nickel pincer cofactor biosynthesis protein LarC [Anaerolineales bacterium]|nr:nickel pincer cofactor biosynthesis protein LarC [Anaerolineales bacterium]
MKIAYFDLIAGASGDMMLGALVDAGLPVDRLLTGLAALDLDDFDLRIRRVRKNGFSATKVDVLVSDELTERRLPEIKAIITASDLPAALQERALAVFERMGRVEAGIHGLATDQVHLHELGGVDTIVDVVGVLLGVDALGIEKVYVSPVPLGRGFVTGAHGQIPLPAPATIGLLDGVPVTGSPVDAETVTPTAAALLTALAEHFGALPTMRLTAVGYGAGRRALPIPNLLRIFIGETESSPNLQSEALLMLESNLDDENPEIYGYLMENLFAAGALDVFLTPIQMKKNRPGTRVSVLCNEADAAKIREILFRETSTLGVRVMPLQRYALKREISTVETPWGTVRVKIAHLPGGGVKSAPEYEDCRRVAEAAEVPLREVYRAANAVSWQ